MTFIIDKRLTSSSHFLGKGPLSDVYLKDEANFPWLILIPRVVKASEIYRLSTADQSKLMQEISAFSKLMQEYFKPHKLNVGALGNVVEQLHIHIVARFKEDALWPQSIWQKSAPNNSYSSQQLALILRDLTSIFPVF